MKILLLSLLLLPKLSFATSLDCVTSSGHSHRDGDEEFSRPIYFTVEDEEDDYRAVIAHIPIPKVYSKAKVESASIVFFMPSISKAPIAYTLTKHEKVGDQILVKFWGDPKTELEARVSVNFEPNKSAIFCRSYLVSTYRFSDSSKIFRSMYE